jgi:hypothetical protein
MIEIQEYGHENSNQISEDELETEGKISNSINHPIHYNMGKIEAIEVIEDWELGFHLGNCLKYICRFGHTQGGIEDLQKARWYLNRYIEKVLGAK